MNKANNKRKKESQEKLQKAFIQLIQTKEVEYITVSDLCKLSNLNRSTYMDIYDLIEKIKLTIETDFASMFVNSSDSGQNPESYLKMFKHIKENQIFYRTYFKLKFDTMPTIFQFHEELATKFYNNKYIDYHCEFFKAGLNAILKKWLNNNCKEKPEEMLEILTTEYGIKKW